MPPPSNPRTNVRRPGAKVSAKPSNNNRRAMDDDDDDGPGGNGMLSSIVDLMGSMGASVNVASEPEPLSTTTASDVLLTEFTLLEQEFSFLSSSFSGSEATPLGSRQSTGLPIDFDNGDDPTNQFVPPPDVLASLKPMSKDRLLQYAAKLTAIVGNFVCRERHRHLLNDHLGRNLDTPATPPCLSPGELSLTASLRSLRLPPVVQTTTISYAEDFEGNETINEYSVIAEIGRGAYGHVVLAVSNKSEETFAIKVMKKSILKKGSGDSVVKREIAVMRKLRHQNIVPLFEVLDDEAGDKVYLVMKYIDNGPLLHVRDDLTCNPMNPDLAIKYLRQLISGLQYLHQHGVIHRDLKPDNIMLDKAGVVYLTDFGVSDIIEHPQGSVQGTEGTPVFLAPELFSESKNKFKGAPVDVWALGITFYMAIYGRAPFYGKSWREVSTKIKEEAVHFPPGASPEWVDVLGRLLEKDPKKRITLKQLKRHPLFAGLPHQATDNFDDTFDASSANITNGSMAVTDEEVRSSMRRLTKPPSVKTVSMSDMTNKKINAAMDEIRTRISEREVKQIGVLVEEEDGDSSETGSDTPKGKRAHPPDQPPALFNPRSGHKPPSSDGARPPSTGVDDGKFAGKLRQAISMNQSSAAAPLNSMFSTSGGNNTARNNGSVEKTPKLPQINTARAPVVAARRR